MLSHFLIGVPSVGKSTFSQLLAQTGNYQIISTDAIRQKLYGDESIQGDWPEIEAEVLRQIEEVYRKADIASQVSVIYDATNAIKSWRIDLLNKIKFRTGTNHQWLAWYLDLPLNVCQEWNQQRARKVPDNIIEQMAENLNQFPPLEVEGFCHVYHVTDINNYNIDYINSKIKALNLKK
jgi:tRNA uridine 5-carbamoylmethylation protein Kti12